MDSDPFLRLFLLTVLLPFLTGLSTSFWIVGKGSRAIWIIPSLIIWYATDWLVTFLLPHKPGMLLMLSDWFVAVVLVACAIGFRRWRSRARASILQEPGR